MEYKTKRHNYLQNRKKILKQNIHKRKQFQNKYSKNIKRHDNTIR